MYTKVVEIKKSHDKLTAKGSLWHKLEKYMRKLELKQRLELAKQLAKSK